MFPDLPGLAAQHPVLLSSSALGILLSVRQLWTATKRFLMKLFRDVAELHSALCELMVECSDNWYRCKARVAKPRTGLSTLKHDKENSWNA